MPWPPHTTHLPCKYRVILRIVCNSAHFEPNLVGAIVALVADAHDRIRVDVRVADHALAIAFAREGEKGADINRTITTTSVF